MECFTGEVISEGIAVGKAHILKACSKLNKPIHLETEKQALKQALDQSILEIQQLREAHKENSDYLSMQILLLEDPLLYKKSLNLLEEGNSAVDSITRVMDEYIESISLATNSYLKERTIDLADVKERIIRKINQQQDIYYEEPFILVCKELHPSFLIKNSAFIKGIITSTGGYNSHGAILSRQFNIPYMISKIEMEEATEVIIDTRKKRICIAPSKEDVLYYKELISNLSLEEYRAVSHPNFQFLANVSSNIELDKVLKYDFDGIGLYRTEMIFMNSDRAYTLEEQYEIYKEAIEKFKDKSICFRTFDIGDDKQLSYVQAFKKGIDNYKHNPELFENQIKALLSANQYNNVKIMFPMITSADEFHFLKNWVYHIQENIKNTSKFKLGIMLETKEALDNLTSFTDVDFISIGTNDLIASIYHVHRDMQKVSLALYLKDLLQQLKKVINFCEQQNIELSICGELAAISPALREFIKSGVKNFSVASPAIRVLNHIYKEFY